MSLPGIIELSLGGRGPRRGFLFDPHRLALPCWARVSTPTPATLVTFDRHFDLVPPVHRPEKGWSLEAIDTHARTRLDERNVDHIVAAMELGFIGDVVVIARAWPQGASRAPALTTADGVSHRIVSAPTLERALEDDAVIELLSGRETLLDVDLDCFTTPSDADPFTIVPWPRALIRSFLRPAGSDTFWSEVLRSCRALTFAREPNHCGGVIAGNRLFEEASEVIFRELLETDLP